MYSNFYKEKHTHTHTPLSHVCMLSHFSRVLLLATLWIVACQTLCPWDSPGKDTGVGCLAFLQGIFLTHVSNVSCIDRWILYH